MDYNGLKTVFEKYGPFDVVIHFAAFKCVPESVSKPLLYYKNNIQGTLTLLKVMQEMKCLNIIFSSSCTVYGESKSPLVETSQIGIVLIFI